MGKPESDMNNKFITISVSDSFREMVEKLKWQLQMSKSRLFREAVLFYAMKRAEGDQNNEDKEGERIERP